MTFFESVNVKGKKYEIGDITRDFLSKTEGQEHQRYCADKISGNGDITPSKLCYEAYKPFSEYKEVTGLSYCFGGVTPYYVTYRALMKDDALVIPGGFCVFRNIIGDGKNGTCVIPNVDPYIIESHACDMSVRVDNVDGYIGKLVTNNFNNCIIVDNMSIRISHNDLMRGISEIYGKRSEMTKLDLYLSISKCVSEKRKNGKDLNWFMYKILILNKIV